MIPATFRLARPAALAALTVLCAATIDAQSTVRVGPNVQVSKALSSEPHYEMQLAADPENPDRLMACSMVWPTDHSASEVVTYVSLDRGRSWTPTLRTRGDRGRDSWDPACAYGPEGVAYSVSENMDSLSTAFERIDRSTDGGRSWDPTPTRFKHGERTFVSIDHTNGPRRGWLYFYGAGSVCLPGVSCRNPGAIFLRASRDSGRTIIGEQWIPPSGGNYVIGYGQGIVLSEGTLLAPSGEWTNILEPDGTRNAPAPIRLAHDARRANGVMRIIRSSAGRPNWPATTEVVSVGDWYYERAFNGGYLPHMAADASGGPFHDRAYLVWPDVRSGRYEVYLSYSADSGKTWSRPRVVNDDRAWPAPATGPHTMHGLVAVNKDGVVGVMWYDRRDHPDNLGWTIRFRASLDGGETFTPSVKVSEVAYDPSRTDPMPLGRMGRGSGPIRLGVHSFNFSAGHTAGFAADAGGVFHALWVGNATRVPQLWSAPITVTGTVQKNGSPALARLVDVSNETQLLFTNRRWLRTREVVEADLTVENVSRDTIRAPLKVRLLDIGSDLGIAQVANADAAGPGEGAVWDLDAFVDGGVLLPGQRTRPKRVRFTVREVAPLHPAQSQAVTGLAVFSARILAEGLTGRQKESKEVERAGGSRRER